jgi:hypothetical protein
MLTAPNTIIALHKHMLTAHNTIIALHEHIHFHGFPADKFLVK